MTLTRYNPFDVDEFSRPLRLFQDSVNRIFADTAATRPWSPSVDIKESEDEIVLHADVPGVAEKDIEIKIEDGTLTKVRSEEIWADTKTRVDEAAWFGLDSALPRPADDTKEVVRNH